MPPTPRHPLRLVASGDAAAAASHTNRFGVTYYLHEGTTRTGRPRWFVRKEVATGASARLPSGFEFAESVNGVVSVRQIAAVARIAPADLDLVRGELARHEHLRGHVVELKYDAIVVHEPYGPSPAELAVMARCGMDPDTLQRRLLLRPQRVHPVMKLEYRQAGRPEYRAYRMGYRGDGGWLQFGSGTLKQVVRYLRLLGTDQFFELG